MKKQIGVIVFCLIAVGMKAQSTKGHYVIPQAALLNGDHSVSGQVQLLGGIERNNWSYGIGAAIDYYKVRTVPLFADLRFSFGKKRSVFSYVNIGPNIAWALGSQYTYDRLGFYSANGSFSNGLYTDIGIGYTLKSRNQKSVLISLGYSSKTISETYNEAIFRDFPPFGVDYHERKLLYTFNRLALRIGVKL
ncbi:MAG: hypothetical protein V4450_10625 [Bacteroidota bacterium]